MSCYLTALSDSNIYCRPPLSAPITQSQPGCHPSFAYPPICQPGTQHCNHAQGGGCCPLETTCTTEGCTDIIEFVFPSAGAKFASIAKSAHPIPADCAVDGCAGRYVPELMAHDLLPTSSTIPNSGVVTTSSTASWEPATWTVTVTGSKTGEVCDASAMATAEVPSGAGRRAALLLRAEGHTCKLSVLVIGVLVLGFGIMF